MAADWPGHFPNGAATVATLVAAGADVNAAGIPADPTSPPGDAAALGRQQRRRRRVGRAARWRRRHRSHRRGVHGRHADVGCGDLCSMERRTPAPRARGADHHLASGRARADGSRRAALRQRTAAGRSDHERVLARLPRRTARDGRVLPGSRRELELDRLRPQDAARRGARIRRHGARELAAKPGRQARTRRAIRQCTERMHKSSFLRRRRRGNQTLP